MRVEARRLGPDVTEVASDVTMMDSVVIKSHRGSTSLFIVLRRCSRIVARRTTGCETVAVYNYRGISLRFYTDRLSREAIISTLSCKVQRY